MYITFFYLVILPREIWSCITHKNWSLCYYFWSQTTLSQGGDLENVHLFHYLSLWVTRCFIILKALQKPPSLCPLNNYREQFCTDCFPDSFVLLKMPSSGSCTLKSSRQSFTHIPSSSGRRSERSTCSFCSSCKLGRFSQMNWYGMENK